MMSNEPKSETQERPPLRVVPTREYKPARGELEGELLGLLLGPNGRQANAIFRELRNGFDYADPLFRIAQIAINIEANAGRPIAPRYIAAVLVAANPKADESSLFDTLDFWCRRAPLCKTEGEQRARISVILEHLSGLTRADRQRQADDLLQKRGIDGLQDAVALIQLDAPSTTRFPLQRFDNIQPDSDTADLVSGLIPQNGLIVVWGPPKCAKSFCTLDVAMHIALGRPYRGRRVTQGTVVYCACEGGSRFKRRVAAFRKHFLTDCDSGSVPFCLLPLRVDLVRDHAQLIEDIRSQLSAWDLPPPVLIVVDTLNRSLTGSESSDEDMAAYIAAADAIREAFQCAVMVVHHCGHDDRRPRGHTSLPAAADVQIAVRRDGELITATVELSKDSQQGDVIVSRLKVVEIGVDEHGEPITSCVIEPVEGVASVKKPAQKLSDKQKIAQDALIALVASGGEPLPPSFGLPAGTQGVRLDQWRDELFARHVLDHTKANPRADFIRIREQLQAHKVVGVREGWIWLVHSFPRESVAVEA